MRKRIMTMGLMLSMLLTGGMEAAAQKAEIKASDVYLGAGYTVGTFSGVTFVASGVCKNHDLQVNYTLGMNKSQTLYWYHADGNVDGALKFKRNSLEMKYGYQFRPCKPLALTPQVGLTYEHLKGCQQMGLYDKGNGSDAWCVGVGFKAVYTPVRHLNIFVAPEYKIPVRQNAYYKDVMNTLDKASGGFAIHMGLLCSLNPKPKAKKGGQK